MSTKPSNPSASPGDALRRDVDLLRELVSFDSRSSASNAAVADLVADRLDAAGVRVERQAWTDPATGAEKVNLLAWRGPDPSPGREGLLLSGHLDVVPADEPDWESDPFALTERAGHLHARGACDMKGFDALAVHLLCETREGDLAAPLALLLSADEEVGSLGARRFAEAHPMAAVLPRRVVVGEPTTLHAIRMHKGHLKVRIDLAGRPAHSGTPHLGDNAIERLAAALPALVAWKDELAQVRTDASGAFPDVPGAVLNLARVEGGEALNVVPEAASVFVGVRLLPGMETAPAVARLEAIAAEAGGTLEILNDSPPMLCPAEAAILHELCSRTGQAEPAAIDAPGLGVPFSSDAGVLTQVLGLECVLCGPGDMATAHRANERIDPDQLVRARALFTALVRDLCGKDPA